MSNAIEITLRVTETEKCQVDSRPTYILISKTEEEENLHDEMAAFDRLRKETAIECYDCSGLGKWYVGTKNEQDCHICLGECETCAYCDFAYHLCTCGETN